MTFTAAPVFRAGPYTAHEITRDELPALQAFFDANPEYYFTVGDAPPAPDEAWREFDERPPPEWPVGKTWLLRFTNPDGDMIGMANVVADLIVTGVWHIGLFIVATAHHGSGASATLHAGLEAWMRASGARWIRLGVVVGNERAERFWQRMGYREVRTREGFAAGTRINTVRVLVKPLVDAALSDYLALVARDNPGAP